MHKNTKGCLILGLCALIWGMAFSAQSDATNYVGPFTFVFFRFTITSIVLFAASPFFSAKKDATVPRHSAKRYIVVGAVLGLILFGACALQQIGIAYTSAAKSGFVTALYIVIIPIIGIFMGKRIGANVWIGVLIALVGLCMLCLKDDLSINIGDLFTLFCAFVFSFHIIVIDKYAGSMNSVLLSAIQFGVGALAALPIMLLTETPTLEGLKGCLGGLLYAAICSGAIAYTLQMIGQKYTEPTLASLVLCLESVFAALGGWILLKESLTPRELFGCLLMLSATVIAQLPPMKKKNVPIQ